MAIRLDTNTQGSEQFSQNTQGAPSVDVGQGGGYSGGASQGGQGQAVNFGSGQQEAAAAANQKAADIIAANRAAAAQAAQAAKEAEEEAERERQKNIAKRKENDKQAKKLSEEKQKKSQEKRTVPRTESEDVAVRDRTVKEDNEQGPSFQTGVNLNANAAAAVDAAKESAKATASNQLEDAQQAATAPAPEERAKEYSERVNNNNDSASNQQQRDNGQSQQRQQSAPTMPADVAPNVLEDLTESTAAEDINDYFKRQSRSAVQSSRNMRNSLLDDYLKNNPDKTESDFNTEYAGAFPEAFVDARYMTSERYRSFAERDAGRERLQQDETLTEEDLPEEQRQRINEKDLKNKRRVIDTAIKDIIVGFFPVNGMKYVKDNKTGVEKVTFSRPMQDSIEVLLDSLDLDTTFENIRLVFRLVRLYASMGIDHNGQMFHTENGQWSLGEDEFRNICSWINKSIIDYGHPMAMVDQNSRQKNLIAKTRVYPAGYLPNVVLKGIFAGGENSLIKKRFDTPADLAQAVQNEWNNYTHKQLKKIISGDEVAQRITVEEFQEGLARIDGIDPARFMQRMGIDTTIHYKFSEIADQDATYAQATYNMFDADKVAEYDRQKREAYEEKQRKAKGAAVLSRKTSDPDIEIEVEVGDTKKMTSLHASLNLATNLAKTNGILLFVPVFLSAIVEHGVGNLQTNLALKTLRMTTALNDGLKLLGLTKDDFKASKWALHQMHQKEAIQAIDAAMIIQDIAGPGALKDFVASGKILAHDSALQFIRENYSPDPATTTAERILNWDQKLNEITDKVMGGKYAFARSDCTNWYNALLIGNMRQLAAQRIMLEKGKVDETAGVAMTAGQLEDAMLASGRIENFITEMMATNAGSDAIIAMRTNNISNFNPVTHKINKTLSEHGVTNAAIHFFIDTYVKYGINYAYMIAPFSRSISYLVMKNSKDITNEDLVMGGGMGPSEAFVQGLRMNLVFDAFTLGRNVLTGALVCAVLQHLGFEPPEDPEDLYNISMWRIGSNVGWGESLGDGKSKGIEINLAWWMNDLTQLGLPAGYALAAYLSVQNNSENRNPIDVAKNVFIDSMFDQIDGNVILDIVEMVQRGGHDIEEIERMMADPNYVPEDWSLSRGLQELAYYSASSVTGKLAPMNWLYRTWRRSALLRGEDAREVSPSYLYDTSEEWKKEAGVTKWNDSFEDRLFRKFSANNYFFGIIGNVFRGGMDEDATGYFWTQMPNRTKADQLGLVYAAEVYDLDQSKYPDMTTEAFEAMKSQEFIQYVKDKFNNDPYTALTQGFFVPNDFRFMLTDYCFSEINYLNNNFDARVDAGEFLDENGYYDKNAFYEALEAKQEAVNEYYDIIKRWAKNKDFPSWYDNYEQLISDYDITYTWADGADKGKPATQLDSLLNPDKVIVDYKLKGNHPTSMLPFTVVDEEGRGPNAETIPYWWTEQEDGTPITDLDSIIASVGNVPVPLGQEQGMNLADVLTGYSYQNLKNGSHNAVGPYNSVDAADVQGAEHLHPDQPTISQRSWVANNPRSLPEDLLKFGVEEASGGVHGDMGKVNVNADGDSDGDDGTDGNGDDNNNSKNKNGLPNNNNKNVTNNWPRYTSYAGKSYGGGGGSSNYFPKIYSFTRSVNPDRPATMYSKTPYAAQVRSYLRPGFETKGSREAYKRGDF